MTALPFIDEHSIKIDATPAQAWEAVAGTMARVGGPAFPVFARLVGCEDVQRSPASAGLPSTMTGFHVTSAVKPETIVLAGRHRFSRYELRFDVDSDGTVRAGSFAAFPGVTGRLYRAAVIGTGGHKFAMHRLLGAIKARAERTARVA
jgi:hypothetical protein